MFTELQKANPQLALFKVSDPIFQRYGRVLSTPAIATLLTTLATKNIPTTGNQYVLSDSALEALPVGSQLQSIFGALPIQLGYCNGHGQQLNCLEWHHSPEINLATTDIVLALGQLTDVHADHYHSRHLQAFFVPAGTLIMLYGTTLHFAPWQTSAAGFKCLVGLLKGVNSELATLPQGTLFRRGKWLLAHPTNQKFVAQGAYPGIDGENLRLQLP
ncbi:DUF4867 family protein [Loigolactobacillus binensis]|uniref:DUF4867 family protein n=1 Tax=Loigolactobacillus binensis TaxID=2559922 RepID=A0ABW3ECA8_9LACO|nr:DUF4867 family protein [Loigolactobacillus binensis]